MGHEYVHVANFIELGSSFSTAYSEYAAYMWNYLTSGDEKFMTVYYMKNYGKKFNPYSLEGNITVNRVINPKYMQYGTYGLFTIIPREYWKF